MNLQDIFMSESFFDDLATTNNNLNNNPTQPPSNTLFDAQVQGMLDADNNDLGNSGQSQQNSSIQDFNNFQYDIFSDDPLFSSPDSFLNSQNSYNSFDDNCSLSTPSPPQFNNLQDFILSPNDAIIQDSPMDESLFDQLLTSKKDLDTLNLMVTQQVGNAKKRNSPFDRDSISPDKSLKKKRNGGISKSMKKSSSGSPLGKQFIKDEPMSISDILKQFVEDDSTSSFPSIIRNDGTTQSIAVPSSPIVPSSNYVTNANMLAFNQDAWNQTIDPSVTNFMDSPQFTGMPLLASNGSSPTAKLPINRLKSTVTNIKSQQNFQSQPNKQQKKVAHNAIERRYRNNINDRINDLKNVVPALCHLKSKDSKDDDVDEVDGIPAATKLNKATILRKATEYITYLKSNNQKVKRENENLRKLIEALPGGVEIYNAYMTEQPDDDEPLSINGHHTPPTSNEGSPDSSLPNSPGNDYVDYNVPPTPPENTGSRALMALFMCMTFFTSQSSYVTQSHPADDHHHEGRVLTNTPPVVENNSLNVNDNTITIDLWYLLRMLTFLMCLTYILRPSLFSSQPRRLCKSNSIITSVLNAKTKNAKTLYQSLSNISNGLPVNTFETIIGLISEFIKFSLRRFLRWDILSGTLTDYEGRLLETALWGRMGEAELCGGNNKVSRLSILYTCLHTVNLLESPHTTRKCMYLSSSRIYANAALQSYIGLSNFPFLAKNAVEHFWKLANREKVRENGTEEKWLQIALSSDQQSEMWKDVVNRIDNHVLNGEQSNIESMKNITIPLMLVTDVQAMIYLKQAFDRLIPIKCGGKKELYLKNNRSVTFLDLVRNTTPNSFTHWYALVGCCIEAFSLGHNILGENFVNRLRDYPTIISNESNYDKQIVAMGLLSYALLMHGKLEASVRCANKASIALTKWKEQRNGDYDRKIELSDELNEYSSEIEQEVHYLTEFCVGWIILEVKTLGWKIVEGLISANNSTKSSANKNEKTSTKKSPSDTTDTSTTTTTNKLPNQLPDILNSERLQNTIILWTRYLRRLSKNSVFEDIKKIRETFINKLVTLERIVDGDHDYSEYDLYSDKIEDGKNNNRQQSYNNNSQPLSESENRANKAWRILKGM